jgi:hypothetical protein
MQMHIFDRYDFEPGFAFSASGQPAKSRIVACQEIALDHAIRVNLLSSESVF